MLLLDHTRCLAYIGLYNLLVPFVDLNSRWNNSRILNLVMFEQFSLWSPYGSNEVLLFISLRALKTTCIEKWFMCSSEPALKVLDSLRRSILFQRMGQLRTEFWPWRFFKMYLIISFLTLTQRTQNLKFISCFFGLYFPKFPSLKNPFLSLVLLVISSRDGKLSTRFINVSFDLRNEWTSHGCRL